jgi:putative FmdB family regulatory protein
MPNYEYRCLDCKRRFDIFLTYAEYGTTAVQCTHCHSANVQRKIGRIRVARSDANHLESIADPARLANLDEDPRSLGRMMRDMSSQVGEDMGPEFHEVVNRLESGQTPDQIEKELPDLGSSLSGGDFSDE